MHCRFYCISRCKWPALNVESVSVDTSGFNIFSPVRTQCFADDSLKIDSTYNSAYLVLQPWSTETWTCNFTTQLPFVKFLDDGFSFLQFFTHVDTIDASTVGYCCLMRNSKKFELQTLMWSYMGYMKVANKNHLQMHVTIVQCWVWYHILRRKWPVFNVESVLIHTLPSGFNVFPPLTQHLSDAFNIESIHSSTF
jgi:hypothetical protein